MVWDLLLYIPTVFALLFIAANFWYDNNPYLSYLMIFLACFFLIAGTNRILKTRLMLMPSSPVAIEVGHLSATLILRNGQKLLLKDIKYYKDVSGRSFGLSGLNTAGQRQQFLFHKGQFSLDREFKAVQTLFSQNQATVTNP